MPNEIHSAPREVNALRQMLLRRLRRAIARHNEWAVRPDRDAATMGLIAHVIVATCRDMQREGIGLIAAFEMKSIKAGAK